MTSIPQPTMPGYSPWPTARQSMDTTLGMPGPQGLAEGAAAGQGVTFSPTQEFYGGGLSGTAPPSSVPPSGTSMWNTFQGSGGGPSSSAGGSDLSALIQSLLGGAR